jgi:DNA-3-methyladenine glycosylase
MSNILDCSYFASNNTIDLAYNLIGKYLVRNIDNKVIKSMITEVEAYHGLEDKASHARFGKTKRNATMFDKYGCCYVYLCYGIHWLLNIVTGEKDFPAAILIRGIDNIYGPGRVTKFLQVDDTYNGKQLNITNNIWVEDLGIKLSNIEKLPRVGINYAQEYKEKLWRYRFINNKTESQYKL